MFGVDYIKAQELGYKFVARDPVGGESAYKSEPKRRDDGYWEGGESIYLQGVTSCMNRKKAMRIEEAIQIHIRKVASGEIKEIIEKEPFSYVKEKRCLVCNKEFRSVNNARYCCNDCRLKAKEERYEREKKKGFIKHCERCGAEFKARTRGMRYCSYECRYAYKHKERNNED